MKRRCEEEESLEGFWGETEKNGKRLSVLDIEWIIVVIF